MDNISNISSPDTLFLCHIDEESVLANVPVICLLVIVMVTGIIGNGLVCTTHSLKPKRSSCSLFILHLALYDILACLTVIPVALVGLVQPDVVQYNIICKAFLFLCMMMGLCSLVTLDLVAVDRFLKICKPLTFGISYKSSKRLVLLEIFTGVMFGIATLFIQGVGRITEDDSTQTYCYIGICLLTNDFYKSEYRLILNTVVTIVFGMLFLVLIVCYGLVMKVIVRRRSSNFRSGPNPRINIVDPPSPSEQSLIRNNTSSSFRNGDMRLEMEMTELHLPTPCTNASLAGSSNGASTNSVYQTSTRDISGGNRKVNATKSAKVLFVVTLAFVVCWVPTWGLGTYVRLHSRSTEKLQEMAPVKNAIILFFQYWYTTNHAINPVIYAFMDSSFRSQCAVVFSRLHLMPKQI